MQSDILIRQASIILLLLPKKIANTRLEGFERVLATFMEGFPYMYAVLVRVLKRSLLFATLLKQKLTRSLNSLKAPQHSQAFCSPYQF
jgi:hypothetical protein